MLRRISLALVGLSLPAPAGAVVESWRASGAVSSVQGTAALLPLPAAVGDPFVLRFSYDDTASDTNPGSTDFGVYPIESMTVSIAGDQLEWVGPSVGEGSIAIQAHAIDPNKWGVQGCLTTCSDVSMTDQARLNLFFAPDTIASDALTDPPDPSGATTVQFGLFSRDMAAQQEAFVVATLESIVACEPQVCGDGVVGCDEQCDDGGTASGDGCSATCSCEPEVCGDGIVGCHEQCDDGNTIDGDACSNDCVPVPEPAQLLLAATGALVLAARRRYGRGDAERCFARRS